MNRKTFFLLLIIASIDVKAQKIKEMLTERWVDSSWVKSSRQVYTYDDQQNAIQLSLESWNNSTNSWRSVGKTSYTNSSDGVVQGAVTQIFNQDSNAWINSSKYTYSYTSSGLIENQINQTWSNGTWVNTSRIIFEYDANGYLIRRLNDFWDRQKNIWKNSTRNDYSNDASGKVQEFLLFSYNSSSSSWTKTQRLLYTYTSSNLEETSTFQRWTNDTWINASKSTYSYDANDNITKFETAEWDTGSTSWEDKSQSIYTYNAKGLLQQVETKNYSNISDSWNNSIRSTYSYVELGSVRGFTNVEFYVYPNPAKDCVIIELPQIASTRIEVLNVHGVKVFSESMTSSMIKLNMDMLPKGSYIIQVRRDNQISSKRFIKL